MFGVNKKPGCTLRARRVISCMSLYRLDMNTALARINEMFERELHSLHAGFDIRYARRSK